MGHRAPGEIVDENGHATTPEFTALAERISGQDLESFFQAWLYTPNRPDRTPGNGFPAE